jgi:hypothetical protein
MNFTDKQPSIHRAISGLPHPYQAVVQKLYTRLLPVLYLLLSPSDIAKRNRTWPGSSPEGKVATGFLVPKMSVVAREVINAYAAKSGEDVDELLILFRVYCRYGPIGLLYALSTNLSELIADEILEYANFLRLAKHPRANVGLYICELLNRYADDLGIGRLPIFLARYIWASDQKVERWFVVESSRTERVEKTTRRLNFIGTYPHQRWIVHQTFLSFTCFHSRRCPSPSRPWLIWITDEYTGALMGYRVCPGEPTLRDYALVLRWSIWHYGAYWWPSRGVPDTVVAPFSVTDPATLRALQYLHITPLSTASYVEPSSVNYGFFGWPETFASWLQHLQQRIEQGSSSRVWTIDNFNTLLLEYLEEAMLKDVALQATPQPLQERNCSLPWSTGISAALLLQSAGVLRVRSGLIEVSGVPYEIEASDLLDGTAVDVRYDPDDARQIYLVQGRASIVSASARSFEHRIPWSELVDDFTY